MMKKNRLKLLIAVLIIAFLNACHEPVDLTPSISTGSGIISFTASFPDDDSDENSFSAEIDTINHIINVVIPYNYPESSSNIITLSELTNMRVSASLDDNVYIEPALLFMDLSEENLITITDQAKNKIQYSVVAEIRKSSKCAITAYSIPDLGLDGVIDETNKTISIVSIDDIGTALAEITISHGATISPDPTTVAQDYDSDFTLTVTAQDETTQAYYTVTKSIPGKTDAGIRSDSRTLMWAKKLVDVGVTTTNITGGIAVTNDYVVINTRGENSIYLNAKTGENVGTVDISSIYGSLTNFYSTADDGDNILISNLTPYAGNTFNIWKVTGVNSTPESFISWDAGGLALGRKISVQGSIDGNAIITAPILAAGGQFARWQVTGGSLVSQTPDIITTSGVSWSTNVDVVYSDDEDLNSDFFIAYYGSPYQFTWFDGTSYAPKVQATAISANWVVNAVDYTNFNNVPYVIHNSVNSFTWGTDDAIHMYDLSASTLSSDIYVCDSGVYGGNATGVQNGNGTGDVAFKVSEDGYYLYVYFMFTNGYVVCVRYDCIDI